MEQFIWYFISGAFIVGSYLIGWRCPPLESPVVAISIAVTPIVGFVFHQIYRIWFELRREDIRWEKRTLKHVWDAIVRREGFQYRQENDSLRRASLIWKTTLFGEESLRAFRHRHLRAWRFITACEIGFWSAVFAAIIMLFAFVNVLCNLIDVSCHESFNFLGRGVVGVIGFAVIGFLLYQKAIASRNIIIDEEIAFLYANANDFFGTSRHLVKLDWCWNSYFPYHSVKPRAQKRGGKKMTKNFDAYLKLDKTGLQNKYVVIVNGEVVAKGEDIEEMLKEVRQRYPDKIPFVAKVPDERMLVL